jgi:alpha-glucosidase
MFNRFGGAFKVLRNAELFQRWAEMSAFSDAVFRTHEGVLPDDSVQAVDPAVSAHFATFARLHMALFAAVKRPLMAEAALTGAPLARHMMLHYPDDDSARRAKDQFMLGADLLVCPVVHEHHTGRSCYVPEGGWTHVLTGETPAPGADFWCHAPIGRPCVLYRPTDKAAAVAAVIRLTLAP